MRHLFLSPHLDDAVLSCGGTIALLADSGEEVTVLTLCAGQAAPPYSPLILSLHELWGSPPDLVALRRAEDLAAVTRLGATALYEDVPDAIYRKDRQGNWLYAGQDDIFGPRRPDDDWLPFYLLERVRTRVAGGAHRIYAPLGVGGHVDHLIAFQIGTMLTHHGYDVSFYEDFPYVMRGRLYDERMADVANWEPTVIEFSESCLLRKIDAFGYYRSQISVVFAGLDVPTQFGAWARAVSGSGDAAGERYWNPPRAPQPPAAPA